MAQQQSEKKTLFFSLRIKLLIGFTVLFSLVFAVAFYWFYNFATDRAMERIEEDLVDTLQAAARGVDGDEMFGLYTEGVPREDGYTDDPRYWRQVEWLATVTRIEPRARLYTYIMGQEEGEIIFISSNGAVEDPPVGVPFMVHWTTDNPGPNASGMVTTTLQNEASGCYYQAEDCDLDPYADDWGNWVSGFTPILDSAGQNVAGLGIDFEADYVFDVQQAIRDKIWVAFGLTYLALFVMVYLLSRIITQPIAALTRVAERIGEGDYEQDLSETTRTRFPDEIATLSRVMSVMVDKVREREQTLIKQVEELKIEIDVAKRQKQVSEIVDSTFFGDLQAQAARMRARRRRTDDDE